MHRSYRDRKGSTMMGPITAKREPRCWNVPGSTATTDATPIVETRLLEAEERYGRTAIMEAIAAAVTEWGADLVVVGTEGRRGLERSGYWFCGRATGKNVEISILLVRPH